MSTKKLIFLNVDGTVRTTSNGFDTSSYDLSGYGETPTIVVDQTLADLQVSYSSSRPNREDIELVGANLSQTVTKTTIINPLTEQLLTGTITGTFKLNEQIVQSTIIPTIVNGYSEGGITLNNYLPTVGTIGVSGEIGERSAQFKGTFNDLSAQKACGIQLPAFTTSNTVSPYFLLEGWIYFENQPSTNYNPIIVTRSADGVNGSTNDSFSLSYKSSSGQVEFHYSTSTHTGAGYQDTVYVSPTGVTTNTWNHFAIAWASRGGSASIKTYWNGTSLYSAAGLSGSIRNSTAPLMIGSGASGDYPLKGWLEDIHLRMGGVTLALADYALLGSTGTVDWQHDGPGDYTVYQMTMNGPFGSSLFPVRNLCRVSGTVTFQDGDSGVIGAGLVVREDSDVVGLTLFDGVCGGFSVSGGSAAYVFGADSGSCMIVSSVQQLYGITAARTIRQNAADHTNYYLFGVTVMYGQSGASGDFPKLLSSGWTANGLSFSFLPIQSNINWLRNIYDNIVVAGYTGNTTIENYYGTPYVFGPTHAKKLYEDVITYQSTANTLRSQLVSQITSASTIPVLNSVKGHTAAILLKLAPSAGKNPTIYIAPKAKESGTGVPESKNLPKAPYLPLGDSELGALGL